MYCRGAQTVALGLNAPTTDTSFVLSRPKSVGEVLAGVVLLVLAVLGLLAATIWRDHDGHDHAWMRKEAVLAPLPGATELGRSESVGFSSSGVDVYYALPREPEVVLREYAKRDGARYGLQDAGAGTLLGQSQNGLHIHVQVTPVRFAAKNPVPNPPGTLTVVLVSVSRPI